MRIPKQVFVKGYPANPKNSGERLRKARMDAGLKINDLARMLGVTEDTVINWELRGMRLNKKEVRVRLISILKSDFESKLPVFRL